MSTREHLATDVVVEFNNIVTVPYTDRRRAERKSHWSRCYYFTKFILNIFHYSRPILPGTYQNIFSKLRKVLRIFKKFHSGNFPECFQWLFKRSQLLRMIWLKFISESRKWACLRFFLITQFIPFVLFFSSIGFNQFWPCLDFYFHLCSSNSGSERIYSHFLPTFLFAPFFVWSTTKPCSRNYIPKVSFTKTCFMNSYLNIFCLLQNYCTLSRLLILLSSPLEAFFRSYSFLSSLSR